MKNIAQVHRNGATKPASTQTKTPRVEKASDPMPKLAICARFKRRGKFVHTILHSDIGISTEEWVSACRANRVLRDSAGKNFFAEAIREILYRKDSNIKNAAEEMNQAVVQSDVLLELIENHLDYREHRSGEDFSGERADRFNFGLALLAQSTRTRLAEAVEVVMANAYPKKTEAVA